MTVYELIQQLAQCDANTEIAITAFVNPHEYELEDFDADEGVTMVPGRQLDMYIKSFHGSEIDPVYIRLEEANK